MSLTCTTNNLCLADAPTSVDVQNPQEKDIFPLEDFITGELTSFIFAHHCVRNLDDRTLHTLLSLNRKIRFVVLKILANQTICLLSSQTFLALRTLTIEVKRDHPNIPFFTIKTDKERALRICLNPDCSIQPSSQQVKEKLATYCKEKPAITNRKSIENLPNGIARIFYSTLSEKSEGALKNLKLPQESYWMHGAYYLARYRNEQPYLVATQLTVLGWFQEATNLTHLISHDGKKIDLLRCLATEKAKQGDIEGVKETARSIQDADQKSSALVAIAEVQANKNDIKGAQETAQSIQDAIYRSFALRKIAEIQATKNDIEGAKETARSIKYYDQKVIALEEIAKVQAKRKVLLW